jgi:hypothetical protein
MIFDDTPVDFRTNEQISPDRLNQLILSAKQQLEDYAINGRWRHFEIHFTATDSLTLLNLPLFAGRQYSIDRIQIVGTYTGSPVVSWQRASGSVLDSWDLTDGVTSGIVNKMLFPSVVMDGITGSPASNSNNFLLSTSVAIPNAMITVSLSTPLQTLADTGEMAHITLYKDGDTMNAARWNADELTVENFAFALQTAKPKEIVHCRFTNITSATPVYLSTDRFHGYAGTLVGSGGQQMRQMCAFYEMDGTGGAGQTLTISAGYNTFSHVHNFSVDGNTNGTTFDDLWSINNVSRSTSSTEDMVIKIENSAATAVKRIDIFVLCQPTSQ